MNHRDYAVRAFDEWLAENHTTVGKKMLDIGARDDTMEQPMTSRGFEYDGIDPFPSGKIREGTFEAIPAKAETYDIIFSCHAFEHCEHPIEALKEMMRVLKPGGYIWMATPFPCQHHILEADPDHIMVLIPMQLVRLLLYTGYQEVRSGVHEGEPIAPTDEPVQNHTIWTVGRKA